MADPILDEEIIKDLLRTGVDVSNTGRIQQGAVFALCDVYDRGVTRDEFTSMASLCLSLYAQCAKLWVLHNIADVYKAGDLDDARFKTASTQLEDIIRKQCMDTIEVVRRLQECPTSEDKVH